MTDDSGPLLSQLKETLDGGLAELQDLLDELAEQNDKLAAKVEAATREQGEIRDELSEVKDMVEGLSQRIDRLTALVTDSLRGHAG